jgi:hypothetical protein
MQKYFGKWLVINRALLGDRFFGVEELVIPLIILPCSFSGNGGVVHRGWNKSEWWATFVVRRRLVLGKIYYHLELGWWDG